MPPKTRSSTSQSPARAAGRTDENVFLFVPNLIGYTRIILAAISLTYMSSHPKYCTVAYVISALLDAVDGQAARALGQTSKLGAMLDMITDRCTTSCLMCFLTSAYPEYALLYQFLISLDFSSHYMHMYSTVVSGQDSHKQVTKEQSRILWSYYNNSTTLFVFCAGNELFFLALYLMRFYKTPLGISTLVLKSAPGLLPALSPATWRVIETITWPQIMGILSFPVCFIKQVINAVQIWKAAKTLVVYDQEQRWLAQQAKSQ